MPEYIEGKRPVLEALRARVPLECIMLADNLSRDGLVADIQRKAKAAQVPVQGVPRAKLDAVSERNSHQGVVAQASPFAYANLQDILNRAQGQFERTQRQSGEKGRALVVVLDHITDAGNLGAIARSADAVGAAGILIPNKRSAHVTAATYKSSAGAIAHLPIAQVANLKASLERCKEAGFWVAGATEKAEQTVWQANLTGKIVLVMGNEGEGLARLTQETCDFLVSLPQVGKTSSLNVAQAATACMMEWLRQNW